MYNSREFLLLELFRALPLKVVWGRNSFREIGPNYVVRFEMSVSWLLLMCVIYLSQVMILTEKWHTGGKKKILSNWSYSCVLFWMKEERWLDLLLAQECAVFLLQYFNNILSVFQNKHKIPLLSVFCFPSPSQPCKIRHQIKQPMSYILMGWAVGIYTRSASTENAGV